MKNYKTDKRLGPGSKKLLEHLLQKESPFRFDINECANILGMDGDDAVAAVWCVEALMDSCYMDITINHDPEKGPVGIYAEVHEFPWFFHRGNAVIRK